MAGYQDNYSKSNNAAAAERAGRHPLTKAAKVISKKYGVTQIVAREWLLDQEPYEWHHYGKMYNKVDIYDTDLDDEQVAELHQAAVERKLAIKAARGVKAAPEGPQKAEAHVKWTEWVQDNPRRRARPVEREYEGVVEIKDDWIILPGGKRKHRDGSNIWVYITKML